MGSKAFDRIGAAALGPLAAPLVLSCGTGVGSASERAAQAPPTHVPAGLSVAKRRTVPVGPREPTGILLGEGWGCARFENETGWSYQCWEAGVAPRAWRVAWLENKVIDAGPDRLCEYSRQAQTFRCRHYR